MDKGIKIRKLAALIIDKLENVNYDNYPQCVGENMPKGEI